MLSVAVVSAMLFTSCDSKKEGEDKKEGTEKKEKAASGYYVISDDSQIMWLSENRDTPDQHKHEGTIKLTGDIIVKDGEIQEATLFADLNSMVVTDLTAEPEKADYLKSHLMNQEFFAAAEGEEAKNPKFEYRGMDGNNVILAATMRGVTIDVKVPVNVTITADEVKVTSDAFTLDFLPFNMPFFAQEKEKREDGKEPTYLAKDVKFSGLSLIAKVQK